jgi:glycogen debranching enzyme
MIALPGLTLVTGRPEIAAEILRTFAFYVSSISEIFDGGPPFTPQGAIAQAWSVAELLCAWQLTAP